MTTVALRPSATPTVVRVEAEKELSGAHWCPRYPRSDSIVTLQPQFQLAVSSFLWALEQAGAASFIANTFRPKEACYLMHFAWKIWKNRIQPNAVASMPGVPVEWVHRTQEESVRAAYAMCVGYKLLYLEDAPALESNHTKGLAIDVSINWSGMRQIKDANDDVVSIESLPRNNMNRELWDVGASYGVVRYYRPDKDKPHWSYDGR